MTGSDDFSRTVRNLSEFKLEGVIQELGLIHPSPDVRAALEYKFNAYRQEELSRAAAVDHLVYDYESVLKVIDDCSSAFFTRTDSSSNVRRDNLFIAALCNDDFTTYPLPFTGRCYEGAYKIWTDMEILDKRIAELPAGEKDVSVFNGISEEAIFLKYVLTYDSANKFFRNLSNPEIIGDEEVLEEYKDAYYPHVPPVLTALDTNMTNRINTIMSFIDGQLAFLDEPPPEPAP